MNEGFAPREVDVEDVVEQTPKSLPLRIRSAHPHNSHRVQSLRLRVLDLDLGNRVWGSGFGVEGLRFGVWG